ncbi:J domain-containing protein [Hymenobacter monticola]|uniref:J domain-containing protein n=1 Tax=Hymenobacter monticola TaxID=1705399 RepID=A0ABY4B6X6_9BACT|nr:J domain-containing protein [Hymenobacter monticola]UOE34052.1 J domain-containing protein [Hymenobacter monticola]
MLNYYRLLGVPPTASAQEITRGYLHQRTRLKRLAAHDRAMKARLAEVETGYEILGHPRRRVAYDLLLIQEPAAPPSEHQRSAERLGRMARIARSFNMAVLACCLLLGLDWSLPLRHYPHETVRNRIPVSVSVSLSDPQLAYRVHTERAVFRLPSAIGHRVRAGQAIEVWQTPLLGVVSKVASAESPDGPAPFRPYAGTIYGTFFLLPVLLAAVAGVGVWPGHRAETYVNTAVVSGLLAIITLVIVLLF